VRAWVSAALFVTLTLLAPISPADAHTRGDRETTIEVALDSSPAVHPVGGTSPAALPTLAPAAAPRVNADRLDRIPDALGLTLALVAGALAAAALRTGRHARRLATSAIGLLLLGFVLESTPHLVHHALDPEHGTGCWALQLSERNPVLVEPLETLPKPPVLTRVDPSPPLVPPVVTVPVPRGRAPPA
jgi:hypothetical protein